MASSTSTTAPTARRLKQPAPRAVPADGQYPPPTGVRGRSRVERERDGRLSERLPLKLPAPLYEALKRHAASRGRSTAQILREAMIEWLELADPTHESYFWPGTHERGAPSVPYGGLRLTEELAAQMHRHAAFAGVAAGEVVRLAARNMLLKSGEALHEVGCHIESDPSTAQMLHERREVLAADRDVLLRAAADTSTTSERHGVCGVGMTAASSLTPAPTAPVALCRNPDMTGKALTLRVTLPGTDPEIWRLVQVPAEMTLARLSRTLEVAFGWYGDHRHTFHASGVTYWTPPMHDDGDLDFKDDADYQVGELLWWPRMKLEWVYDLGDCWHHDIRVASIYPADSAMDLPRCVAGGAANPLEDCGGLYGYYEMVHALSDTRHPLHDDAVERLGEDFDPARFDGVELVPVRLVVSAAGRGTVTSGVPSRGAGSRGGTHLRPASAGS